MPLRPIHHILGGTAILAAVNLTGYFTLKSGFNSLGREFEEIDAAIQDSGNEILESIDAMNQAITAVIIAQSKIGYETRGNVYGGLDMDNAPSKPLLELCNNNRHVFEPLQDCEYVDSKDFLIEIEKDSTGAYLIQRAADFENGTLTLPAHEMPPSPEDRQMQETFLLHRDMG